MNIQRLALDVDKAISKPSIPDIAEAIEKVPGVEGVSVVVDGIDVETVGMNITVEGQQLDYKKIITAIENTGAVVHSIDQIQAGKRIIESAKRER